MIQLIHSTKEMLTDSRFLKKALMIACPVALQGMLNTVVNLADTLMIGSLGATAIAAVGLANKVFFVFSLLVFGIVSGAGILAAQFWGSGDVKNIRKVLGLSILLALAGALFFVVPAIACPKAVMRIFTTSEGSIELGARYLRLAALTYPFIALTNVYVAMLRAVNKVVFPVISSCIAILTNICLNYVLIFGNFGAPCLGVAGAAVATLIARVIELCLVTGYVYRKRLPLACGLPDLFGWKGEFIRKFAETSAPVIANEFMWGLGTTMYSLAYGRMGDNAVAAITIATTIQDIVVVLFQGLSAATAVILGNELGAGKLKRAEKYATNFFILQFLVMAGAALVVIGIRTPLIGLYHLDGAVARDVSLCILVFAAYMPPKMFNYVNVVGVLRSGGDTKMCLFLDTSGVWLIGVPLAFLGALVWKLPIYLVYALVLSEEIYKMILGYIRYRQKKWLRNLAAEVR
ncbi:MAG: MATE family efflux transporter [Clostridiales bacterium]|nr:MATE family efflux transporter [Clostridiales bacterium]